MSINSVSDKGDSGYGGYHGYPHDYPHGYPHGYHHGYHHGGYGRWGRWGRWGGYPWFRNSHENEGPGKGNGHLNGSPNGNPNGPGRAIANEQQTEEKCSGCGSYWHSSLYGDYDDFYLYGHWNDYSYRNVDNKKLTNDNITLANALLRITIGIQNGVSNSILAGYLQQLIATIN